MNGVGWEEEWLQFTSKDGFMEQPELIPIPNGYGTVKFPHLLSQPGFTMFAASEKDFPAAEVLVVVVVEGVGGERLASASERYKENKIAE